MYCHEVGVVAYIWLNFVFGYICFKLKEAADDGNEYSQSFKTIPVTKHLHFTVYVYCVVQWQYSDWKTLP